MSKTCMSCIFDRYVCFDIFIFRQICMFRHIYTYFDFYVLFDWSVQVPDLVEFKGWCFMVYLWNSTDTSSLEQLWLKTPGGHVESSGCAFADVSDVCVVAVAGSYRIRLSI